MGGVGLVAVSDPASSRLVYGLVAALVLVALGGAVLTVWYWRATRPDPRALGRLEMLGLRRWGRADFSQRRQLLDDVAPFVGDDGPVVHTGRDEPAVAVPIPTEATPAPVDAPTGSVPITVVGADEPTGSVPVVGDDREPAPPAAPDTLADLVGATPAPDDEGSLDDPITQRVLGLVPQDREAAALAAVPQADDEGGESEAEGDGVTSDTTHPDEPDRR